MEKQCSVWRWLLACACVMVSQMSVGQTELTFKENKPVVMLDGKPVIQAPAEGLWSVATGWQQDWMTDWHHANPTQQKQSGGWTIVEGDMSLPQGDMHLRDAYEVMENGLIHGIRRYEWRGKQPLEHVTLSVRLQMQGDRMQAFIPGVLYYGNKMGAQVNAEIIPVYNGEPGEWAIFEDHRYPMPFAMLENDKDRYAAAVHTTPSPVRGAVVGDQWWSLGVEAYEGYSEFVLYSGPIGYNRQHSISKSLQRTPMKYTDTYITLYPGTIIEKEFYIEPYTIERKGSGFQRPVYTTLDLYKPYYVDRFPSFNSIVEGKYRFALGRWIDEADACGFNMYDHNYRRELVMGWCGQADSNGFALQWLIDQLGDETIPDKIQRSMDFLSNVPVDKDGMFSVRYVLSDHNFVGNGDHVSCGQAMYSFAKAIVSAKQKGGYNTAKWEAFLKRACDGQSRRILRKDWNPRSTAEGFFIAPLTIAADIFGNDQYRKAAVKAARLMADRHLEMDGCYWGGTLDATCEDKEGAWAAFQGFITLYETTHEAQYLTWAKHAMDVALSYVVVWDIPLPAGRMANFAFKTTGWTVVSPQNQHIDVYGVFFTPEIYKMGTYLNDERLQKLARVMYRTCYQLTDPYGSQGEQLQQTNFAQHGDMSDVYRLRGGYSESWTVFWITSHFLNAAARFKEMGVEP